MDLDFAAMLVAATLDETIRNTAWNMRGIPHNPMAAFPKYARENGYGVPLTTEFDVQVGGVTYRLQGFSGAIIYCKVGDWANIKSLGW